MIHIYSRRLIIIEGQKIHNCTLENSRQNLENLYSRVKKKKKKKKKKRQVIASQKSCDCVEENFLSTVHKPIIYFESYALCILALLRNLFVTLTHNLNLADIEIFFFLYCL